MERVTRKTLSAKTSSRRISARTLCGVAVGGIVCLALACGGAGASGGAGSGSALPPPGESAVPIAEEPQGGTAASGSDCDFGGAERYTCASGLVCCYPTEGEVAYGTCVAECEGYD